MTLGWALELDVEGIYVGFSCEARIEADQLVISFMTRSCVPRLYRACLNWQV